MCRRGFVSPSAHRSLLSPALTLACSTMSLEASPEELTKACHMPAPAHLSAAARAQGRPCRRLVQGCGSCVPHRVCLLGCAAAPLGSLPPAPEQALSHGTMAVLGPAVPGELAQAGCVPNPAELSGSLHLSGAQTGMQLLYVVYVSWMCCCAGQPSGSESLWLCLAQSRCSKTWLLLHCHLCSPLQQSSPGSCFVVREQSGSVERSLQVRAVTPCSVTLAPQC